MAVSTTPVFPQTPKSGKVQILPADASALKTVVTAGANGSKVVALIATSSDTATRDVTWGVTRSAVFYPLGTVTVAINAGQVAGTFGTDLMGNTLGLPTDSDNRSYIFLESGDTLQVKSLTTVTTAKEIDVTAVGADF